METEETKKIRRVEQILIRRGSKKYKKLYKFLDTLCFYAKDHYNMMNFEMRQSFLENDGDASKIPSYYDKASEFCKLGDTQERIGSVSTQDITKTFMESWKSFKKITLEFEKDPEKYCKKRGIDPELLTKTTEKGIPLGKPKMPKYLDKDKGRYIFVARGRSFKPYSTDKYICSVKILNNLYKKITGEEKFVINSYRKRITTEQDGGTAKLNQVRIVPKADAYVIEMIFEITLEKSVIYEDKYRTKETRKEEAKTEKISDRTAAIKLGVNDFLTLVNNFGESPLILSGSAFKPIIDAYIERKAYLTSIATTVNNVHTTRQIQRLSNKVTRQTKYIANMYSKYIVEWCKKNQVTDVVLMKTKGMKQGLTSKYAGLIPTAICENQLLYKLEEAGISVKDVNGSNTKNTSFLDLEPTEKKYENKNRIKDGIFMSNDGIKINSSVNTTFQAMRKRYENAFTKENISSVKIEPLIYTVIDNKLKLTNNTK